MAKGRSAAHPGLDSGCGKKAERLLPLFAAESLCHAPSPDGCIQALRQRKSLQLVQVLNHLCDKLGTRGKLDFLIFQLSGTRFHTYICES